MVASRQHQLKWLQPASTSSKGCIPPAPAQRVASRQHQLKCALFAPLSPEAQMCPLCPSLPGSPGPHTLLHVPPCYPYPLFLPNTFPLSTLSELLRPPSPRVTGPPVHTSGQH
eukprot:354715-Chlamydomonas_euryale.AAC.6